MADPVLQTQERNKLAAIVASLPDFTDSGARGKRELVRSADLGKFLSGIVWSDSDRVVAGSLVSQLDGHGFLQERPEYHALGALLVYLLDHPSVTKDDATYMATLVVKYGLVRDEVYIQNLRAKYSIAETSPPSPVSTPSLLVTGTSEPVSLPKFVPIVQDKSALEKTLNSEDNFLDIYLLLGAIYSAYAVGRVEVPEGNPLGTGWLIGPDLLLTNCHVLPSQDYVSEAVVRFDYTVDASGVADKGRTFKLTPGFYYASPAEELDYALVRLEAPPLKHMMVDGGVKGLSTLDLIRLGKHRGYLLAVPRPILNLQRVNIIQHPARDPLKVVLTQNHVTADMSITRVHYRADTKRGSSGSPVFNQRWEVIALHHSGEPYPPDPIGTPEDKDGRLGINEGIPMKAILEDFKNKKTLGGHPLMSLLPQVQ